MRRLEIKSESINWPTVCSNCFVRPADTTIDAATFFIWTRPFPVPYCSMCKGAAVATRQLTIRHSLAAFVGILCLLPVALIARFGVQQGLGTERLLFWLVLAAGGIYVSAYASLALRIRRTRRILQQSTISVPVMVLRNFGSRSRGGPRQSLLISSGRLFEFLKGHNETT